VSDVRFVFERGRIVHASAGSGEEFLLRTLETDDGASRVGELGIGCNPGIQRFTKNVGFDEKIDGTIHLAIGSSYSSTGGTNVSNVHWDMVKDLRHGGRLYAGTELVQEDGRWLI
jgi:aminopeptidase